MFRPPSFLAPPPPHPNFHSHLRLHPQPHHLQPNIYYTPLGYPIPPPVPPPLPVAVHPHSPPPYPSQPLRLLHCVYPSPRPPVAPDPIPHRLRRPIEVVEKGRTAASFPRRASFRRRESVPVSALDRQEPIPLERRDLGTQGYVSNGGFFATQIVRREEKVKKGWARGWKRRERERERESKTVERVEEETIERAEEAKGG
eukprot:601110-Amorphochlora_amoeboformis.AAC.1